MRKNTWKKIASGAMALTMVAGQAALPANIGGFLTGGTSIVASAASTDWTATDSLPTTAGEYKLTADVTLSSTWEVTADITIDLNGHGIIKSGDHVIRINNGATLTINDSGSTTHYFDVENNAEAGKAINVNNTSGSHSFTGGYITGGGGRSYNSFYWNEGGGIYVYNGHLVINGGTILGNSGGHGGGVCIYSGDCVMNGGTVCYNSANEGGAGIGFRTGSSQYNNGIGATTATFTMNAGLVTNNKNGGVATCGYSYGDDNVTINGGTITGNTGTGLTGKHLTISGNPTITGNEYGVSSNNITLSGAPVIKDNVKRNLFVNKDQKIIIGGALTNTTPIGVTLHNDNNPTDTTDYVFTTGGADYVANFTSDAGYVIKADGENLAMALNEPTVTAPTAITGLRYTGAAQPLVEAGSTDGGTLLYSLDDRDYNENVPTESTIGSYNVYYYVKGGTNYKDTDPVSIPVTISAGIANVTVPKGAVIEGQEAAEGIYKLECGKTYNIYSDEALNPSDAAGLDISTANDKAYGEKTYNYKYTVAFADTIVDGTEIEFAHKHAAKAFSTDETHPDTDKVWVYCEGEPSADAKCVAELKTDGTYYYGDAPTVGDVTLNEYFGAVPKVTDFFFTKKGDTTGSHVSEENMVIGETYVVNATIAVTIDNRVSNFAITREIEFAACPLEKCDVYLVDGENETKLDIKDGTVTVPADTFTYTGEEQAPVIVIKNDILGTETVLTENDYTGNIEAQTDAGNYSFKLTAATGEDASYSGDVTVNWSIAKANADIQVKPAENIVYDGAKLDQTDFVFEGKDTALVNNKTTYPDTTVTVTGTDITNAGDTTANVKLTFANYNDIALDVPVTINKREVKVTPAANQSTIYGTEAAPVINVTTEKAADADGDGEWDTKTGVIPADAETVDFSPTVDIAEFDYTYFVNNAGTYSYKISDAVLDNYTAILDGTAVFTVKPKKLTKEMFTPDAVDYTFDGKQHNSPEYTFSDGKFSDKKRTSKLTSNDFEEGGTDHAILPGSYTLEFSGQGNYTGYVTFDWEIKPIEEYAVSLSVTSKAYDGKVIEPTSFVYKSDDSNKTAVTLPGAKTVYTYYEYDGESTVDEAYIGTLTPLDGVPKDAGKYIVVATVTAKGYALDKVYANFTINQKEITITPNATGKTFGEADPDLAAYTYDESAVAEGDTVRITGKYALPDYNGNAGTYPFDLGTIKVDSENYFLTISGAYVVNRQKLTDANITVFKDCTVTDDGWWYPGDCVTVTGTVGGKEIKLVRPVYDYNTNDYINTDFAFISATKTKKTGAFSVQIEGVGNYTGFAEAIINVRNADYDHQAAIEAGIGVDLADAVLKDGTKARFVLTPSLADGWTVEAYGIVYDKTGKIKDADAAKSGLVLDGDYVTKTCSATSGTAYALNITPTNGNTIWAVGYITVSKDGMSTTIYTEPKSGNVDDLKAATEADIEANVNVTLADAVLKDGTKARFVLTPEIADGWTVDAYGIVYDKTGAITSATSAKSGLVLNGSYVTKTCSSKDGTAYALNITPTDNNTIWAVGYITVTKDGLTKTIYTEPKSANVTEMQIGANVKVSLADAVLKDGTKARFVLTPTIADGWTVDAYGIVYDKTGKITDADAAGSGLVLGGSYVTKTCSTNDGTAYALNITPVDDKTIWAVGYITVTKDGVTKTIYTAPKSAKVSELN